MLVHSKREWVSVSRSIRYLKTGMCVQLKLFVLLHQNLLVMGVVFINYFENHQLTASDMAVKSYSNLIWQALLWFANVKLPLSFICYIWWIKLILIADLLLSSWQLFYLIWLFFKQCVLSMIQKSDIFFKCHTGAWIYVLPLYIIYAHYLLYYITTTTFELCFFIEMNYGKSTQNDIYIKYIHIK